MELKKNVDQVGEPVFEGLSPEEITHVINQGTEQLFAEGKIIFEEGSKGDYLYVVLGGEIAIYVKRKPIAKCTRGDAFGEMALLNRKPRTATAVAITTVKLLRFDEDRLNRLLSQRISVRLLLNIIHILSERLEVANERITDMREKLEK